MVVGLTSPLSLNFRGPQTPFGLWAVFVFLCFHLQKNPLATDGKDASLS